MYTYLAENKRVLLLFLADYIFVRSQVHSVAERSDEAEVCRSQQSKVLAKGDILPQKHDRLV